MVSFLPEDVDPENLLNHLRKMAKEITLLLKSYSQDCTEISKFKKKLKIKNFSTGPVTSADIEVNEIILKNLKNNYPSLSWEFLSEENKNSTKILNDWVWIIDPLDGTKDFIQNTGEYAVHIALTYKKKVILSMVLIPSKEEIFIFLEGQGTWCESLNGKKINLIKPTYQPVEGLRVVTSRSHLHQKISKGLSILNPLNIIGMGSIGYKVASILKGEADLYITYSAPGESCPRDWDFAAPFAILKGHGGLITDLQNNEISFLKNNKYQQGGFLMATLNTNHKDICKILENIFNN